MENLNFDGNLTDLSETAPQTERIPVSEKDLYLPRKNILSSSYSWGSTTAEELAIRREKNRLAAAKCRAKKAEKFQMLNDYREKLIEDNKKLKERNLELKTELELYKIRMHYAMMNTVGSEERFQTGTHQQIVL